MQAKGETLTVQTNRSVGLAAWVLSDALVATVVLFLKVNRSRRVTLRHSPIRSIVDETFLVMGGTLGGLGRSTLKSVKSAESRARAQTLGFAN